jgi:hypothetical protein
VFRQTLDNIYLNNAPRQVVVENAVVNPEALQDFDIGTTIIEKVPNSVRYDAIPFTADKTFAILEYLDQVVEKRTGISQRSMALDMEALSEQTATAVRANQAAVHTKVEEYARNIAEHGGLKRVFSKMLKLIVKHQDRERTVRIRDKWITVDPRAWNAEMDVTINTGLGSGSREHDLTMLMGIATKQEQIILQLGPTNPLCGVDKLFDTYRLLVEAAGIKPADRFFPEVTPEAMQQLQQQQAQRKDPKVQAAEMQAQAEAQKMQMQAQLDAKKMQTQAMLDEKEVQAKLALDQQTQQFEQQMKAMESQREAELQQLQYMREAEREERQAQADIAVRQKETQAKAILARAEAEFKAKLAQQQFAHERALAASKFEFDKKIKLLDLYVKQRTAAMKPEGGGGGKASMPDLQENIDFDNILAGEGMDMPSDSPVSQGPLQQISEAQKALADSQAQLAQALRGLGQNFADGNAGLSSALAEMAKPKRKRVLRDENNRVIGAEDY